jgi:hypothetical protein
VTDLFRKLRAARWLALWLILPALLLRAGVPEGFMPGSAPASGAAATVTMTMCPGHAAPVQVRVEQDGSQGGHAPAPVPKGHHEPPCVFAAASGLAFVPVFAGIVPDLVPAVEPLPPREAAPPAEAVERANSPRAPPRTA